MKAGLRRYKEMIGNTELNTDQKVLAIQKEVEEATALELPMLQKNLVFLSTITSVGTLIALLGTVMGMIRSFSALGDEGGGGSAAGNWLWVFLKHCIIQHLVSVLQHSRLLCTMYLQLRLMLLPTALMNQDLL